jgi:hypothetical protein
LERIDSVRFCNIRQLLDFYCIIVVLKMANPRFDENNLLTAMCLLLIDPLFAVITKAIAGTADKRTIFP